MNTSDGNISLTGQAVTGVTGFAGGFVAFLGGCRWLFRHPGWLSLLLVPFMVAGVTFTAGVWAFFEYSAPVYDWLLFARPESAFKIGLWYALKAAVGVAMFIFILGCSLCIAAILSSPVFDRVSLAIERDILGVNRDVVAAPLFSMRIFLDEFKKGMISLFLPLFVLLIPGVNVLTPIVTAMVLAWNLYDYPLARRGLSLGERIRTALRDAPALIGLGIWLIFPLAQVFLLPFAIAGATLICCERIRGGHAVAGVESKSGD
jgi:CysZ protein